jgi:hypothetical protein
LGIVVLGGSSPREESYARRPLDEYIPWVNGVEDEVCIGDVYSRKLFCLRRASYLGDYFVACIQRSSTFFRVSCGNSVFGAFSCRNAMY